VGSWSKDEASETVYLVSVRPRPIRSRNLAVVNEGVAKQLRGTSSPLQYLVFTGKGVELTLRLVKVSLEILGAERSKFSGQLLTTSSIVVELIEHSALSRLKIGGSRADRFG
jgi:hypothetical protein